MIIDEAAADVALRPEELSVRRAVRAVLAEHVAPYAAEADRRAIFPDRQYRALVDAGLGALPIAVEHGGSGHSTVAYAVAVEEIAAACGSTSLVYMTQMHAAWPILRWGTPDQQRQFVPRLCRGEIYGSIAISEPSGGSDVAALTTSAKPDGDDWVLDGSKIFITTGDRAGVVVVFATVDRDAGHRGVTAFLVEPASGGMTPGQPMAKMGMHASSTVELFFDSCRVPGDMVLGEVGRGFPIAMSSVVKTRISAAAQGVGFATAALRLAHSWARERGLLDPKCRHGQVLQSELARLRTEVLAGRTMLYQTARVVDDGDGGEVAEVSAAKLYCTDLGVRVSDRVVDLLGADGDLVETGAERLLRDALVTPIYDGTNEIQRMLIARDTYTRGRET